MPRLACFSRGESSGQGGAGVLSKSLTRLEDAVRLRVPTLEGQSEDAGTAARYQSTDDFRDATVIYRGRWDG